MSMRWWEMVDPDIPCKNCIIKTICSKYCEDWKIKVENWSKEQRKEAYEIIRESYRRRDENAKRGL